MGGEGDRGRARVSGQDEQMWTTDGLLTDTCHWVHILHEGTLPAGNRVWMTYILAPPFRLFVCCARKHDGEESRRCDAL